MDKYEYFSTMMTASSVNYGKSMNEFLNDYGKQGWELVSLHSDKFIYPDSHTGFSKHWFIFKRKINKDE